MPRIFKHLEAGCLQVNLMSTSAQINQLKYTILYYTKPEVVRNINRNKTRKEGLVSISYSIQFVLPIHYLRVQASETVSSDLVLIGCG